MGKQTKLTKAARGQMCQIRIPGVCNHDPETTVLAHLPGGGMAGKTEDIFGAHACYACHREVDRETRMVSKEDAERWHLDGMVRTIQYLLDTGQIEIIIK